MPNYYPDENPFQLPPPPKGWLKELQAFDADLVLLPSRQEPFYRLGRRSKRAPGLLDGKVNHPLLSCDPSPDTKMLAQYRLVPVTTVNPGPVWDSRIFSILRSRDIWAVGGPEKAADLLDAKDEQKKAEIDKRLSTELDARVSDHWDSLHYRSGSRVSMAHSERPFNVVDKRRVTS